MITTTSENLACAFAVRDCADYRCHKCVARTHWNRRKAPRSGKNPARRHTGRT
jgi:hypothetical protein